MAVWRKVWQWGQSWTHTAWKWPENGPQQHGREKMSRGEESHRPWWVVYLKIVVQQLCEIGQLSSKNIVFTSARPQHQSSSGHTQDNYNRFTAHTAGAETPTHPVSWCVWCMSTAVDVFPAEAFARRSSCDNSNATTQAQPHHTHRSRHQK